MKKIKLALVGRPNVGKSALFNRICKKRISIVDEMEGVTRDRIYAEADFFGKPFDVIDTGGISFQDELPFIEEVKQQAEIAIEEADVLVMVVDARTGVQELDREVAKILLKTNKPLVLAINKVDHANQEGHVHEFYGLGISQVIGVSATQGNNIAELLEKAFAPIDWSEGEEEKHNCPKLAIIGRANVGKSTLLNAFLEENRSIVSPIAGTTRDSIDAHITIDSKPYLLIDTAGIRRKKSESEVVDKFAAIRTERAIERADICLMLIDVQEGITAEEKKILQTIEEMGKGCILLFNKWDLVKGFRMEHCLKAANEEAQFLSHCPKLILSAKTRRNLDQIFPLVDNVYTQMHRRISTGELNQFVKKAIQLRPPPMITGKRLRVYYLTQVKTDPPRFILFVNYKNLLTLTYKKYLLNQFRKEYGFDGAPLFFQLRAKSYKEKKSSAALV